MLALAAGGAAGGAMLRGPVESHAITVPVIEAAARDTPNSFADVAERVRPAVVSVQVRIVSDEQLPPGVDPKGAFGEFFRRGPREGQAQGSGFFISSDGFIVTNNHVVQDGRSVTVTLDNGRKVNARVVAVDQRTDLAVLKTEQGSDYPYVRFARAAPRVGDWVLAVGNPFGLGGSVTAGIVSASGRDIGAGPYDDFLQIDAPVNQGSSGGPIFNMSGEVVGVSTAIASPSGGNVGIAFAIPAANVKPVVETLRRGGQVVRGFLGVTLQPVDDDMARAVGLGQQEGALVAEVTADGPAARAGIQTGDVILRADGQRVSDSRDLARAVAAHRPGSRLKLDVLRSGRRMQATATLSAMPPDAVAQRPNSGPLPKGEAGRAGLGINVTPAPGSGVQIVSVDPGSVAASRGLTPGDLILEAGGRPCASAADLERAADAARRDGRGAVLLRVQTGDQARYVGLSLTGDG